MIASDFQPKQLHLVLIGGGHAQIQVLKSFAMKPIPGLAITLITDVLYAPYSGMLPGFVEGVWSEQDIHIDLTRLASFAGATLIHDEVKAVDPDAKMVEFTSRPAIHYDILSLNCGAVPDLDKITGAKAHSIAVKPIAHFLDKLPQDYNENQPINIIGAGVAGLELAFALKARYASQDPVINVFSRSKTILPSMPKRAGKLLSKLAADKAITIHNSTEITALSQTALTAKDGQSFPAGLNFIVTGVRPSPFIASLRQAVDETGFIAVNEKLQSSAYPEIFAAGDVASLTQHPREKAGVFAVRAGAILATNIRNLIYQRPLKRWRPQKHYLSLIGTGDGKAVAIRNWFVGYGTAFWLLKVFIDKAFMDKFSNLPEMVVQAPRRLPYFVPSGGDERDPVFEAMRCSGCAAKASATLLDRAMGQAKQNAKSLGIDANLLSTDGAIAEDAGLTPAISADLRHSFDSLSQMVSDPFLFAQIAVNHALSDLYVSGAKPLYAQAHVTLEEASEAYQETVMTQLLTGSLMGLGDAGARLIGGHTSQSRTANLGFAVTGAQKMNCLPYDSASDYALVMTKPLGIGTALAAHMRQALRADSYHSLIETMLLSNRFAAETFFKAGAIAMTDITGFGLARHAQNMLARLPASLGYHLRLSDLAIMPELQPLIEKGLRSSLYQNNKQAGLVIPTPAAAKDWRLPLLFDPQTSGGVLALVPADKAYHAVSQIVAKQPQAHARVIGQLMADTNGLLVEL